MIGVSLGCAVKPVELETCDCNAIDSNKLEAVPSLRGMSGRMLVRGAPRIDIARPLAPTDAGLPCATLDFTLHPRKESIVSCLRASMSHIQKINQSIVRDVVAQLRTAIKPAPGSIGPHREDWLTNYITAALVHLWARSFLWAIKEWGNKVWFQNTCLDLELEFRLLSWQASEICRVDDTTEVKLRQLAGLLVCPNSPPSVTMPEQT